MATITLNASGNTGLTGMTISSSYPITNAYNSSSNTSNYARYSISTSTTGYVYLTYDTSDIPANATIQSVTANARLRISSTSRVTNTICQLYTGTTAKGSSVAFSSTSSGGAVVSPTADTWTRSELNDLRMRIGGTGSSSSQSKYIYIYGTDITITYTVANPRTIISTLTGNGTINPSGTTTKYDGDTYELTITPTNLSDAITITNNGTDVTSQLAPPGTVSATEEVVLGTYTLSSGSFNGSGATYFSGLVGKGYDNSSQTTTNYYSGGSGTIAVFTYDMGITIPSNATITDCYVMVNGHAESTSQSSEYMCAQIYAGSTAISSELNFKSIGTSNSTQTIHATTLPTATQCANLKLQCRLGYYGGAINGATIFVEYTVQRDYYTYTYIVNGNATIAVTIGTSAPVDVTGVSVSPTTGSIEVGDTLTLTATVTPTNATDKSVTWSSSNTSVATVSNGTVTGVSGGTAVITVTTTDGGYTATCTVTVIAVSYSQYTLATTISPGKSYLIADGNSGSVHVLTSTATGSGYLAGVSGTVTNNVLSIRTSDVDSALFDYILFDSNEPLSTIFTQNNDSQYLYISSSTGLVMHSTSTVDRYWHHTGTKLWQCKPSIDDGYTDNSTEYKNYLVWDNSNSRFDDAHLSGTGTDQVVETSTIMPPMYLYTLDTGSNPAVYLKQSGAWVEAVAVYKKINGSWVLQTDANNIFNASVNYIKA